MLPAASDPSIARTRDDVHRLLEAAPRPIGLVPTMGALHEGHRSLLRRCRAESATAVAWIFVNPRQFDRAADFRGYPRDEAADIAVCAAEGVDIVFAPTVEVVYPPGFDTTVRVGAIAERLEGAARPGHFEGVTTVVARFFGIVRPDRAYFGEKDAQQLRVIRRMVADLAMPIEIVACPTVREPDGLAASSRNALLTPEERAAAAVLHRALRAAADAALAGERSAERLRAVVREIVGGEPLATLEYVSCADDETLDELETVDRPALLSLAAWFGEVRLIDNILLA
jgi:pantoate--beta-alanine ligase